MAFVFFVKSDISLKYNTRSNFRKTKIGIFFLFMDFTNQNLIFTA